MFFPIPYLALVGNNNIYEQENSVENFLNNKQKRNVFWKISLHRTALRFEDLPFKSEAADAITNFLIHFALPLQ